MWLRNWYSILNATILSRSLDSIPAENPTDTPPITLRGFNGSYVLAIEQAAQITSNNYRMGPSDLFAPGKFAVGFGLNYNQVSAIAFTIIFGTGTTSVTVDDYRIETPITSGSIVRQFPQIRQIVRQLNQ